MKKQKMIMGSHVRYFDYMGFERFGTIVAIEPYPADSTLAYIYILDEEPEYNVHQDIISGVSVVYAELRPSDEVYLD